MDVCPYGTDGQWHWEQAQLYPQVRSSRGCAVPCPHPLDHAAVTSIRALSPQNEGIANGCGRGQPHGRGLGKGWL